MEKENRKENRIAVIGIVIHNREESSRKVNEILSDYGEWVCCTRKKAFL